MRPQSWFHTRAAVGWRLVVASLLTVSAVPGSALTPESPEVQRAILRGITYLESDAANDTRVGAKALVGIALLKQGIRPDHPKIVAAVGEIRQVLKDDGPTAGSLDIYSTGLSIVFLVQLDPIKYRSDIDALMRYLRRCQKPHGGWGYPERETGDTSMTQYAVLSSWEAAQVGMPMPIESIEAVTSWLLRTQDPSGGFGYQGTLGDGTTLVAQGDVRHSMTAAGLGSLSICATLLGMIEPKVEKREEDLPLALKRIKPKDGKQSARRAGTRIDERLIREARARGVRWLQANYEVAPFGWTHYYLYALERCMTFLELVEHQQIREPKWYNDGASFLLKTQAADGSWSSQAGAVPDTAFSVLFLMRSTRKSVEKAYSFGRGTLLGGRGLPKDTDRVEVRAGQVVTKPLLGPAESLLASLDNPKGKDQEAAAFDMLAELPAPAIEALIAKHGDQLRRLVDGRLPETRIAAVRALGKTRNLREVPVLIYALGDPNWEVVRAAHDALLRISREPAEVPLPEEPGADDRRAAIEKWKAWYLAIRPEAEGDF